MNSRWLWNLHQRHKFFRAEASRDILKTSVSEMAGFQEVFSTTKRHVVSLNYKQDWEQCH